MGESEIGKEEDGGRIVRGEEGGVEGSAAVI